MTSDSTILGVFPILPAASGLLAIVAASALGLLTAIASLRLAGMRSLIRAAWRQKLGLTVLGLLAFIGYQSVEFIGRKSVGSHDPIEGTWPVFRGTLDRTGHVDRKPGPLRGGIQWSAGRGYDFPSSPAIVDGHIFAVGSKGDTARFFCWNALSGEQVWSMAPPGYRATFSSPVIDQGHLICGEGLHQTTDSRLMCFKLEGGSVPKLSGHFRTHSHIECTPVVSDGRIYFGAGDDGIYCLEVPKESATELRTVWHAPGDKYPDAETALVVHQGRVYAGLGFGGEALCVLDAVTGAEIRRIKLPLPCFSPPAIHAGRLYLGLGRSDYMNYRDVSPGEVRCLDLKTLETIWQMPTPAAVLASIVAHGDNAIFSTVDGQLFSVDRNGRVAHHWQARVPVLTAPAVTDRVIYCVGCDGLMTGLNLQLERLWSVRIGAPGEYISSPVVYQGHVYVGTPHDGMLCVGEAPVDGTDDATFNNHSQTRFAIPRKVEVAWTFSGPVPETIADVTAPPTVTRTEMFVPMCTKSWNGLVCAEQSESKTPPTRWVFDSPERIEVSPRIRGDLVVCLCGKRGHPGSAVGIDRQSGNVLWNHPLDQVPNWLEVDADSIFIQSDTRLLTRLGLRGETLWQTQIGHLNYPIQVQGAIVVAAATNPHRLVALDRISGQFLWNVSLSEAPVASPILMKAQIFVATAKSIEVHSLLDGSVLKQFDDWSQLATIAIEGDRMVGTTSPGELLIGTLNSRSLPRRVAGARPDIAPIMGLDAIVDATDERRLRRISLIDETSIETWYETVGTGRITMSPVSFEERTYVAVEGVGLVCLKVRSTP